MLFQSNQSAYKTVCTTQKFGDANKYDNLELGKVKVTRE